MNDAIGTNSTVSVIYLIQSDREMSPMTAELTRMLPLRLAKVGSLVDLIKKWMLTLVGADCVWLCVWLCVLHTKFQCFDVDRFWWGTSSFWVESLYNDFVAWGTFEFVDGALFRRVLFFDFECFINEIPVWIWRLDAYRLHQSIPNVIAANKSKLKLFTRRFPVDLNKQGLPSITAGNLWSSFKETISPFASIAHLNYFTFND